MNFTQFLLILNARKWIILGVLLFTVAVTAVVSLLLPKEYTATTTLIIDSKSKDPFTGQLLPSQMFPGYMATQIDVIKSCQVAQKVVRELKLAENPATREQFMEATEGKGTIEQWLGDLLLKKLDAEPSRESSVIIHRLHRRRSALCGGHGQRLRQDLHRNQPRAARWPLPSRPPPGSTSRSSSCARKSTRRSRSSPPISARRASSNPKSGSTSKPAAWPTWPGRWWPRNRRPSMPARARATAPACRRSSTIRWCRTSRRKWRRAKASWPNWPIAWAPTTPISFACRPR